MSSFQRAPLLATLAVVLAVTACAGRGGLPPPHETFASTDTYARNFPASDAATCEAARRALLSQGYVINTARPDLVHGRKNFQPERETHVEVELRIVCAPEGRGGARTIAFVSAQQDRYALKKSNAAASLGVGVLGSVSLPFSSSDDSMVKVASETITHGPFYDRFFALLDRYLERPEAPAPAPEADDTPPMPAPPAPPVQVGRGG